MRPLTLEEFAQALRMEGNEFADEILDLCHLEEDVADPYGEFCDDLAHYAPEHRGNPSKALEWLGDRSQMLAEIETHLENSSIGPGDADDLVKQTLDELGSVEEIMREHGGWTEGDLQDALFALIERASKAPAMEYDL